MVSFSVPLTWKETKLVVANIQLVFVCACFRSQVRFLFSVTYVNFALIVFRVWIDQFRYIKIQSKTIDFSTRLVGITTEFAGFIPTSLVLKSIVLD